MANKWHSIDRRIYGEGTGDGYFAEAFYPHQAEQIVREHNEREEMREALANAVYALEIMPGGSIMRRVIQEGRAALSTQGQKEGKL